jgi:hypothetical protein
MIGGRGLGLVNDRDVTPDMSPSVVGYLSCLSPVRCEYCLNESVQLGVDKSTLFTGNSSLSVPPYIPFRNLVIGMIW